MPSAQLAVVSGEQPPSEGPPYVSDGMRRVSVVADGTPIPHLLATAPVVEGYSLTRDLMLPTGPIASARIDWRHSGGHLAAHWRFPDVVPQRGTEPAWGL